MPDLLADLTRIVETVDAAEALPLALKLASGHLPVKRGTVFLVAPDGEIHIAASWGPHPERARAGRPGRDVARIVRIITGGEARLIPAEEVRRSGSAGPRDSTGGRDTLLCAPIRLHGQTLGALALDCRPTGEAAPDDRAPRLLRVMAALLAHATLEVRDRMLTPDAGARPAARPPGFVGNSAVMQKVYDQLAQVAPSATTVLLLGESGTGKELAARAIHAGSERATGPFVAVNCGALPENLIENELFGHERGAFTGADAMRKGRFELADGGVLFLDEVGELALSTQARLLRALQERCFERLGGMTTRAVDVRVIAATNRDLEAMVEAGTFRRDLFYRLNVFPLTLPPLRARPEDILPLANHFAIAHARKNSRQTPRLSLAVMGMLQRYAWPGNIRELENVMERAALLLGPDGLILPRHLPAALHSCGFGAAGSEAGPERPLPGGSLREQLEEVERAAVAAALEDSRGQLGRAAAALGLTERVMALRMRKYGISYKSFRVRRDGDGEKST